MIAIVRIIIAVIGMILIINAISLLFVSNFNLGIVLVFAIGLILLLYSIWQKKIHVVIDSRILKISILIITIISVIFASVGFFIYNVGKVNSTKFNEDAVIVLGAGIHGEQVSLLLAYRLDKCVDYLNRNTKAVAIVSGGQGPQENITEALAMEKYLITKGIHKSRIIKEEKATSTLENFKYSKEIIDKRMNKEYRITYITNDFHSYRAGEYAKKAGLRATSYNARNKNSMIFITYSREILAVLKYWVMGE